MQDQTTKSRPEYEPREGCITSLDPQKKQPDRISVALDGTFAFGLWRSVVERANLSVGQELSVDKQKRLLEMERFEKARHRAMDYIAYKPRTVGEVRKRLRRAGYADTVVEDVVAGLIERGLLDDAAYAAVYVESRMSGRGYGPYRIRQELRRRGVESSIIKLALEEAAGDESEGDHALPVARKRWRQLVVETDERKRRKRLMDYLVRRGFSYEVARDVTERVADDERNPEDEQPLTG